MSRKLFLNRFHIVRELGEGSYGFAVLAEDSITDEKVALKIVSKDSLRKTSHIQRLRREINILRMLQHPSISTDNVAVLVMEYLPGGDLFEYIVQRERLSEVEARQIFRQLASALYYCHMNNIAHRDAENRIKIIDFGFCKGFHNDAAMSTFCGSLFYCAPEMLDGTPYFGGRPDIWSLGVILFVMVNGYLPFNESNPTDLYELIKDGLTFDGEYGSDALYGLLRNMISADSERRYTIQQVCGDPYINEGYDVLPQEEWRGTTNLLDSSRDVLFSRLNDLEKNEVHKSDVNWASVVSVGAFTENLNRTRSSQMEYKSGPDARRPSQTYGEKVQYESCPVEGVSVEKNSPLKLESIKENKPRISFFKNALDKVMGTIKK